MPWAYDLALWQYDVVATRLSGKVQFRRPYPRPLISEDIRWNKFLLDAMAYIVEAERVFSRPPEEWGDKETAFASEMMQRLSDAGFSLLAVI